MRDDQILKIYGEDYKAMTVRLLDAARLAERIPSKSCRIGLKPNLVVPSPAEFGATTHPQVVAGIIEYLQQNGFHNILICEGSWVGDRTSEAYEYCGYRELCETYQIPFVDNQKQSSHKMDCAGMELNICDVVDSIDFLINVPVLKGHCQTKITCALKNMKGMIPNTEKRRFHSMGLHKPIAHLSQGIHQDFIIVDHICGDLDFEEGGNPVVRNCVMAAVDPVLMDSYACSLLGFTPDDVPYIRLAEKLGSGCADLEKADIITVGGDVPEEELPREQKLLQVAYAVDEVDSCSACYGSLIPALFRLKKEGLLAKLRSSIAIGQGHRGKSGELGIGRCTKDFSFCVMGCPPDEETIYSRLKEYILAHKPADD